MSEPAELTALCADYDITEASGKVRRAEHDIVELIPQTAWNRKTNSHGRPSRQLLQVDTLLVDLFKQIPTRFCET